MCSPFFSLGTHLCHVACFSDIFSVSAKARNKNIMDHSTVFFLYFIDFRPGEWPMDLSATATDAAPATATGLVLVLVVVLVRVLAC